MDIEVSLLLFALIASSPGSAEASDFTQWAKLLAIDFPTENLTLGDTIAYRDVNCAQLATRRSMCKEFCFDDASLICTFFTYHYIDKRYSCSDEYEECTIGAISCYRELPPREAFVGVGSVVIPPDQKDGFVDAADVYDIPIDTDWNFEYADDEAIRIDFEDFDITNCGCACASLEIINPDTGSVIDGHRYCGNDISRPIKLKTNKAKIRFISNGTKKLKGFGFRYKAFKAFYCVPSVQVITATSGEYVVKDIFDTPMTCIYRLNMPAGQVLKFSFTEFDLGPCCSCVKLSIQDAAFSDKLLGGGAFCGSNLPLDIPVTISENVDLVFTTDGSPNILGFTLTFEAITAPTSYYCSGNQVITDQYGILRTTSSFLYNNNMACSWRLQAPAGSKIVLYFLWFQVEEDYDTLTVTDVASGAALGGSPLYGSTHPAPIESTGNELDLTFSSDNSIIDFGFQIYFYTI